jgi:PAS domain S-box-containing protein
MNKIKEAPCLRQIFLRMLLFRLFIPLMFVGMIAIGGVGYLAGNNLEKRQIQVAESISQIVVHHINHGERILDAVANVAETSGIENLYIFMKSTWAAYGYLDTIYYLDKDSKIMLMYPFESRYTGVDMSNLPNFKENIGEKGVAISRPFISLRTGEPTVYLIRPLLDAGYIIGELNLGLFQQEIINTTNMSNKDFVFIMDQAGTLLAHPSLDLVKQQSNMSNLGIFNSNLQGKANAVYPYNGSEVIGSAVRVDGTGWIVVDQVSLYEFISYYAWPLGVALLVSLVIWLALALNLRKQLHLYVIDPLEHLTVKTNALTIGDFNEADFSSSIPTAFSELNKLFVDFQFMTNNLQLRETALRESENSYRGLIERLPIGLFSAKLTGEIFQINPIGASILGYPNCEELLKVNIINFLCISLVDKGSEQFVIENIHNMNNFETQIRSYDGKIIWVQIDSHIFYDTKEEEEFFEGNIQDITERKHTEAKINEQQELLFEAEKEKREALEKALTMKDEFISLISHEFKTPLNVIYSAIQLIECVYLDKVPERVKELIGNMKQNTFRQLRLSNNLLDVTRMNSGEIKLNIKNIDIVFLSKAITESVELFATQKNIKILFISNVQSKIISIDEEKFERIILNILSNAMKFTPNGGEIIVALNDNRKLNLIEIKVTDTGIGIPKDKQALIFERFGQVDSNLSRQAEGTGIGLSLVKSLVDILGGAISVESELGSGSTFTIKLPIRKHIVDDAFECRLDIDSRLINEIKVEFSDIYL